MGLLWTILGNLHNIPTCRQMRKKNDQDEGKNDQDEEKNDQGEEKKINLKGLSLRLHRKSVAKTYFSVVQVMTSSPGSSAETSKYTVPHPKDIFGY